jgi:hypothetical protein
MKKREFQRAKSLTGNTQSDRNRINQMAIADLSFSELLFSRDVFLFA